MKLPCLIPLLSIVMLALNVSISEPVAAQGQSQLEAMLHRLDTGRDGDLDPNEMVGGTREWVQSLGFDPEQYYDIDVLLEAHRTRGHAVLRGPLVRKVPGFGNGNDGDAINTPGFGANSSFVELSYDQLAEKYGESVMEQVNRVLSNYDGDGNEILDPQEIENTTWGKPLPSVSDVNRDSSLSRTELALRYFARDKATKSGRRNQAADVAAGENGEEPEPQVRARDMNRPNNTRVSGGASSEGGRSSGNSGFSPEQNKARYDKFVESVMGKYDKNEDFYIDQEERESMRNPPEGADADEDGRYSREELFNHYAQQDSSVNQSGDEADNGGRRRDRDRRGSRRSGSLADLDTNNDGQIQMNEFSETWDSVIYTQFLEKDTNQDGVITAAEWSGG